MRMSVGQVARLCGVSIRTLHYYDKIGLVKPSGVAENGYRYYEADALPALQEVMFYKELELPLEEIARIVHHPQYDRAQALQSHKELLELRLRHIQELLKLLEHTIGGEQMDTLKTTLADIGAAKAAYAKETEERYGGTRAFEESKAHHYSPAQELDIAAQADAIFADFAAARTLSPQSEQAQALAARWQAHITKNHYRCTLPILSGLADMYVADARFTQNLDRFGEGTAQFMHDAIKAYCRANRT